VGSKRAQGHSKNAWQKHEFPWTTLNYQLTWLFIGKLFSGALSDGTINHVIGIILSFQPISGEKRPKVKEHRMFLKTSSGDTLPSYNTWWQDCHPFLFWCPSRVWAWYWLKLLSVIQKHNNNYSDNPTWWELLLIQFLKNFKYWMIIREMYSKVRIILFYSIRWYSLFIALSIL
jgi:hypothetical protein